jgi:hypothetical protein
MSLTGFAFTRCGRWIGNGERALRFVLPPLLLDVLDDPSTEARHATSVTLAPSFGFGLTNPAILASSSRASSCRGPEGRTRPRRLPPARPPQRTPGPPVGFIVGYAGESWKPTVRRDQTRARAANLNLATWPRPRSANP